ncbi:helix-turn-helix transcriptional regulator [Dysgonomonas sp. 521]|uniref:helix-turn-helix domain-containing protein n=1 Tax=Dysgonomonas sp. 521 TaxID=2302932 RepID=UPI0013D01532
MNKLRIQEVLDKYHISAAELGRRLGVSRSSISNTIINGNPGIQMLIKWADAIGCNVTEFIESDNKEELTALIDHHGQLYRANSIQELEEIIEKIKSEN